jgi:transposase
LHDAAGGESAHSSATEFAMFRITDADRRLLTAWTRAGTTPQRLARRARIVLLVADGHSARAIARRLSVSTHSVSLWRRRFAGGGAAALVRDAPGRGRKATVIADAEARVRLLLATPPPEKRWTVRALAAATGISRASIHRVLKARRLTLAQESDEDDGTRALRSRHETAPWSAAN